MGADNTLTRRMRKCPGDMFAGGTECGEAVTGAYIGSGETDNGETVFMLLPSCDSHRHVLAGWGEAAMPEGGIWTSLDALTEPEIVAELQGDSGALVFSTY